MDEEGLSHVTCCSRSVAGDLKLPGPAGYLNNRRAFSEITGTLNRSGQLHKVHRLSLSYISAFHK